MLLAPAAVLLASAPAELRCQTVIPDSPAGRFVATFLAAYNSADPQQLERFNAAYGRQTPPENWTNLHALTGQLTPVRIEESGPNQITVLLTEELGDGFWRKKVDIDPADPMKVTGARFGPAARPPEFAIKRLQRTELHGLMERRLAQDAAADRFAGTIVVARHGSIIYRAASGLADRTAKVPVGMESQFRIGSANKMFTAVAILQLVERGKVELDAPIGTYLPAYPNADFARSVTIRQLLTHTGGAGDIFTPEYRANKSKIRTLADYVELFGNRAPDTSEDGRTRYANYGYVLLGRIIEVVSGEDYYDYVANRIFAPAGMIHSGSLPEIVPMPRRARGYTRGRGGKLADNNGTLPFRGSPAGGGYTTADDLIRFASALRSGRLLSKVTLDQATSPQRSDGWYGFGFAVSGQGAMRSWGHSGGAPGMNAVFRVYPELDAVVVVLANLDPQAAARQADFYVNRLALEE